MEFRLHNKKIGSIFSLKQDENSATFALGWSLAKCDKFCTSFIKDIVGIMPDLDATSIQLQRHHKDHGYTDIEIMCEPDVHLIIEAKKLWQIPAESQLKKYIPRLKKGPKKRFIVTLSAASQGYVASRRLPKILGIPVVHRSWADIHKLTLSELKKTRKPQQKIWLGELEKHLRGYVSMQDPKDNTAYVLSLASGEIKQGSGYTWIDVVEKDRKYFHPIGKNGWPALPPNYIAFRYGGKLRGVHHIESHIVVRDLQKINRFWPKTNSDHFVYTLGPAMKPVKEVRNGNIYPMGRYWCAIDTLLSGAFGTIYDARDETDRRLEKTENE